MFSQLLKMYGPFSSTNKIELYFRMSVSNPPVFLYDNIYHISIFVIWLNRAGGFSPSSVLIPSFEIRPADWKVLAKLAKCARSSTWNKKFGYLPPTPVQLELPRCAPETKCAYYSAFLDVLREQQLGRVEGEYSCQSFTAEGYPERAERS
jgi:hypothetical protein